MQDEKSFTVLAVLQNQWFNDPDRVREIVSDMTRRERRRWDSAMLFMGCLSGRRLKRAFGEDAVYEWETTNASAEIGGQSAARFPADLDHLRAEIEDVQPDLILAFGKIAAVALPRVWNGPLIIGPHPAARPPIDAPAELARMAGELEAWRLKMHEVNR
jgi:hypothetical protein